LKRANLRRKWSTIPKPISTKQQHFTISRHASPRGGFLLSLRGRTSEACISLQRRKLVFQSQAHFGCPQNHLANQNDSGAICGAAWAVLPIHSTNGKKSIVTAV
jgi:hypothetical protein